jgi:ATP-dependent DNA helicase RecG
MEYLAERGKITNREYRQMFNISQETAANDLAVLVERSLVKRHGSGRSTVYHLISDAT